MARGSTVLGLAAGAACTAAPLFLLPASSNEPVSRTAAGGAELRGAEQTAHATGRAPHTAVGALSGVAVLAALTAPILKRRGAAPRKVERCAFESELGVQAPVGFWDPLDFCKDGDAAAFKRRRTVEIKHGRICMYACIGYITPEYFRWPGDLSPSEGLKFADVPNGLAAFSKVPVFGWLQILAFCGALEATGWTLSKPADIGYMRDASMAGEPGNYGLGVLGAFNAIKPVESARTRRLNAELANGRLAMVAILGMLFQNGTVGTTGPDMWWFESLPEYAGTVGDFIPKNV